MEPWPSNAKLTAARVKALAEAGAIQALPLEAAGYREEPIVRDWDEWRDDEDGA